MRLAVGRKGGGVDPRFDQFVSGVARDRSDATARVVTATSTMAPPIKAGRLRALATGGAKRSIAYPEIPTVAESGLPGFEWSNSYALFAPAAVPAEIVAKLNREVGAIALLPEVQKKLAGDVVELALLDVRAALTNEGRLGGPALEAETRNGAARFAAGKGRGGDFGNI